MSMTNQQLIDLLHLYQPIKLENKLSLKEVVANASPAQIESLRKLYSADPLHSRYLNRLLGE